MGRSSGTGVGLGSPWGREAAAWERGGGLDTRGEGRVVLFLVRHNGPGGREYLPRGAPLGPSAFLGLGLRLSLTAPSLCPGA